MTAVDREAEITARTENLSPHPLGRTTLYDAGEVPARSPREGRALHRARHVLDVARINRRGRHANDGKSIPREWVRNVSQMKD